MSFRARSMQVLVVEDDELSRELLTMVLGSGGYRVQTADSGDAAIGLLQKNADAPPDVVLCDLQMPGTGGIALATVLRSLCGPATRLLAMSASRVQSREWKGFDAFLLKPFAVEEFAAAALQQPSGLHPQQDPKPAVETPPPAAESSNATPCLIESVYCQLVDAMQPSQVEQLYALCLNDTEGHIAKMRQAAAEGDDALFRREAHTIKGSCGMVGAAELQTIADKMESQGLHANHVVSLDEMLLACERLRRMLVAHRTA